MTTESSPNCDLSRCTHAFLSSDDIVGARSCGEFGLGRTSPSTRSRKLPASPAPCSVWTRTRSTRDDLAALRSSIPIVAWRACWSMLFSELIIEYSVSSTSALVAWCAATSLAPSPSDEPSSLSDRSEGRGEGDGDGRRAACAAAAAAMPSAA